MPACQGRPAAASYYHPGGLFPCLVTAFEAAWQAGPMTRPPPCGRRLKPPGDGNKQGAARKTAWWAVDGRVSKERETVDKHARVRGITDEQVEEKTGKPWAEWVGILDRWGVAEQGATLTARYLRDEFGLDSWWAQAVTMRYEYERGARG